MKPKKKQKKKDKIYHSAFGLTSNISLMLYVATSEFNNKIKPRNTLRHIKQPDVTQANDTSK